MDGFYHGFTLSKEQVDEIISAIEKSKVYLLPEKINAYAFDGVFQDLVFYDKEAQPIAEIGGQNPCLVSKKYSEFTDLLSGIIKPYIQDLFDQDMKYDLFDPSRHEKAVEESEIDVNKILQSFLEERD